MQMLLLKDPAKRLGSGPSGATDIKKHPFFNNIDWSKVYNREVIPQFVPCEMSQREFRYFQIQNNLLIARNGEEAVDLLSEELVQYEDSDCGPFNMVNGFSFFKNK